MSLDSGSAAAEMTIVAVPVFLTLTLFTVFVGRTTTAAIDVDAAAAAAARSASNARSAADAGRRASATSDATLSGHGWACTTRTETADLRPGGTVAVTVSCRVPLEDLGLPVAASRTLTVTVTEPVDRYREWP